MISNYSNNTMKLVVGKVKGRTMSTGMTTIRFGEKRGRAKLREKIKKHVIKNELSEIKKKKQRSYY